MPENLLRSLPVEVLKQLPDGVGKDPAKLREALKSLPLETLQGIGKDRAPAENEPLSTEDQVRAAAPEVWKAALGPAGALVPTDKILAGMEAFSGAAGPDSDPKLSLIENLKKRYNDSIDHGKEIAKKVSPEEAKSVLLRGGAEGISLGLSEPLVSGTKAAIKTLTDGGDFKGNYKADVDEREALKKKLPVVDMASQAVGALSLPVGLTRKAAATALEGAAPGVAKVLTEGVAPLEKGSGFLANVANEGAAIATEGGKGALDVAEQAAVRKAALGAGGFKENDPGLAESAETGAKVAGGLRAAGTVFKGASAVGKVILPVFFGGGGRQFNKADIEYYLSNFDRLKGKEPKIGEVSDAIGESVNKIRDDFNNAKIDESQAKEAVKAVEEQIKIAHADDKLALRDQVRDLKAQLNTDFQEAQAGQRAFAKELPRGMAEDVEHSVKQARQAVVDAHVEKMGILQNSKDPVSLAGLTDTIENAAGALNVGNDKIGPLGAEAKAAQNKLLDYRRTLGELQRQFGDEIPAREAYKLVNQIDKDTEYFSGLTGFKDTADATMARVRGDLQSRIVDAVPGYGEALDKNREAGRFLDQVTNHFDTPENIFSTLNNIHSDNKYIARGVLHQLGERTGKDFGSVIDQATAASERASSPAARAAMKQQMAREVGLPDLEAQIERNPIRAAAMIRDEVQNTPQFGVLQQATAERQQAEQLDKMFAGFTDMSIENKVRAVMNGKEAVKRQMSALSALSDQDFETMIRDLEVLGKFNKTAINGSRRVNAFTIMGYSAMNNSDASKRFAITSAAAAAAMMFDQYGPKMARGILDGIGNIQGMVTADKIEALSLPENVKQDLVKQFSEAMFALPANTKGDLLQQGSRASFYGSKMFSPTTQLSPQEVPLVKAEIQNSKSMSNSDKALSITDINRTGQFKDVKKLLLGNRPTPAPVKEQLPPELSLEQLTRRLKGGER